MSEHNPWKTLKSRIAYALEPWMKVREDEVIRPDGSQGFYSVVQTRLALGVVALTPQREVYLVGQYRYPTEMYSWEIIEGGGEENEPALEGIKRELQEEAGLIASDWQPLGEEIHLSNCISSERALLFLAQGLSETTASPDPTEVLQIKKLPLDECLRWIDEGKIKDAMSIIGLHRVSELARQGKI